MQQQIATLALAAACLCLTANGAMISKRGLSESQMQYGGRPGDPPDLEETSTSTGPAWPIGSVPGMNIYDIYSYENAHNFDLRPFSRRPASSSSLVKRSAQIPEDFPPDETPTIDLPPSETLTTDLAPEETLLTTDLFPHEVIASIVSATATAANDSSPSTDTINTAASPSTTDPAVLIARTEVKWPWDVQTWTLADGQIAPLAGICKSDYIGDWVAGKRDVSPRTKLGPQDIIDRYLPYLDFRALVKRNEAAKRAGTLPYGVAEVSKSITVYTDMDAYKAAVVTWYNQRTGVDNVCGSATPPLLRVTSKTAKTTKTTKAQDSVTKKLANANANIKFSKPAGGNTLNYKREVDDGRKEPARVDAGTVTRAAEGAAQGTETLSWTA